MYVWQAAACKECSTRTDFPRGHDDHRASMTPHHTPKVVHRVGEGPLAGDELIPSAVALNMVGIDVIRGGVTGHAGQNDTRVIVGKHVVVAIARLVGWQAGSAKIAWIPGSKGPAMAGEER